MNISWPFHPRWRNEIRSTASLFWKGEKTSVLENFLGTGTSSCFKSSSASPGSLCIFVFSWERQVHTWIKSCSEQVSTSCMLKRTGETWSIVVGLGSMQWGLTREHCLLASWDYYAWWTMQRFAHLPSSMPCSHLFLQPSLPRATSPVLSLGHPFG